MNSWRKWKTLKEKIRISYLHRSKLRAKSVILIRVNDKVLAKVNVQPSRMLSKTTFYAGSTPALFTT